MKGLTGYGVGCALATVVALAAAATNLGLTVDGLSGLPTKYWSWIDIVMVACSSVACAAGVAVLTAELCRAGGNCGVTGGPWPAIVVMLCVLGMAAQIGMLASLTVYLQINDFFSYWDLWTDRMKAIYIFGCNIGVAFWMIALVLAFMDMAASKRRQVADVGPPVQLRPAYQDEFMVGKSEARTPAEAAVAGVPPSQGYAAPTAPPAADGNELDTFISGYGPGHSPPGPSLV